MVLPTFDNCQLGENNTGLFYKDTDFALNVFEDHKISLPLNAAGIQQLASSPPKVIMPFQLFIGGTLVARNSVEPISICPGIFNRSVSNISRSWLIIGCIEPDINFSGEINKRFTRRGSRKKPQVIKLGDYHAIIRNLLDEFRRLQDEGFIPNVPVLPNEANSELGSSLWVSFRDKNVITLVSQKR